MGAKRRKERMFESELLDPDTELPRFVKERLRQETSTQFPTQRPSSPPSESVPDLDQFPEDEILDEEVMAQLRPIIVNPSRSQSRLLGIS